MKKLFIFFVLSSFVFSCENDDSITPVEDPQVIAEFRTNLSELNLYAGNISDLVLSTRAFPYELNTPLFTDYAHKQRSIALPPNTSMEFDGDGFPIFPNNTVIAKTFYYNVDERDLSLGRQIIETRVLIKINGDWESGDYKWNEDQTDAVLEPNGSTLPITWIDANGVSNSTTYAIPSSSQCFDCHNTYGNTTPIGPKLRTMNFEVNGVNQLQKFLDNNQLRGLSDVSSIGKIVDWNDTSESLEDRARSYFDINCAHCHIPGGFCETQSTLNLAYETSLEDSNIQVRKNSILFRVGSYNPGVSMPFIGTTMLHDEGVQLIQDYLDTL
ncbi:hypothetical protein [Winogradskyella sp.]|uniref:hypothetical protein n=1 Tax=Winogradskyella sp. TaxID=1883156 RepID=UPI003F6D2677